MDGRLKMKDYSNKSVARKFGFVRVPHHPSFKILTDNSPKEVFELLREKVKGKWKRRKGKYVLDKIVEKGNLEWMKFLGPEKYSLVAMTRTRLLIKINKKNNGSEIVISGFSGNMKIKGFIYVFINDLKEFLVKHLKIRRVSKVYNAANKKNMLAGLAVLLIGFFIPIVYGAVKFKEPLALLVVLIPVLAAVILRLTIYKNITKVEYKKK